MNNSELEKKIRIIISELSDKKGFICSVDILLKLDYLSQTDYMNWRNGKIKYLEKVCKTNLNKLTTINRTIKQIATKMNLKPSWTGYNKYGKVPKISLRFSKSGDKNIEKAYATHWINEYQIKKIKENNIKTKDTIETESTSS
jgi:hypothetical protein